MATSWFLKELISRPLHLPSGQAVLFDDIGGDMGILETSNEYLIGELNKAGEFGRGGVVPITSEQYGELKKNSTQGSSSRIRLKSVLEALHRAKAKTDAANAAAAAKAGRQAPGVQDAIPTAAKPQVRHGQPIEVPTTIPKPRKLKEVQAATKDVEPDEEEDSSGLGKLKQMMDEANA